MNEERRSKVSVARVIVMEELVNAGEIDEYLRDEVKKECEVYGSVINCIIHLEQSTQRVRVFVEFSSIEEALKAYQDFSVRTFNAKQIVVDYYSEDHFKKKRFNEISLNF